MPIQSITQPSFITSTFGYYASLSWLSKFIGESEQEPLQILRQKFNLGLGVKQTMLAVADDTRGETDDDFKNTKSASLARLARPLARFENEFKMKAFYGGR